MNSKEGRQIFLYSYCCTNIAIVCQTVPAQTYTQFGKAPRNNHFMSILSYLSRRKDILMISRNVLTPWKSHDGSQRICCLRMSNLYCQNTYNEVIHRKVTPIYFVALKLNYSNWIGGKPLSASLQRDLLSSLGLLDVRFLYGPFNNPKEFQRSRFWEFTFPRLSHLHWSHSIKSNERAKGYNGPLCDFKLSKVSFPSLHWEIVWLLCMVTALEKLRWQRKGFFEGYKTHCLWW